MYDLSRVEKHVLSRGWSRWDVCGGSTKRTTFFSRAHSMIPGDTWLERPSYNIRRYSAPKPGMYLIRWDWMYCWKGRLVGPSCCCYSASRISGIFSRSAFQWWPLNTKYGGMAKPSAVPPPMIVIVSVLGEMIAWAIWLASHTTFGGVCVVFNPFSSVNNALMVIFETVFVNDRVQSIKIFFYYFWGWTFSSD